MLGNHDWWHGPVPGMPGGAGGGAPAPSPCGRTCAVLENDAVPLRQNGRARHGSRASPTSSRIRLAPQPARAGRTISPARSARVWATTAPVILADARALSSSARMPDRVVPHAVRPHPWRAGQAAADRHALRASRNAMSTATSSKRERHLVISGWPRRLRALPIRFGVPPEIVVRSTSGRRRLWATG